MVRPSSQKMSEPLQPMTTFKPIVGVIVHEELNDTWTTLDGELVRLLIKHGTADWWDADNPPRMRVEFDGLLFDGWLPPKDQDPDDFARAAAAMEGKLPWQKRRYPVRGERWHAARKRRAAG
jgi:hypothetical protein